MNVLSTILALATTLLSRYTTNETQELVLDVVDGAIKLWRHTDDTTVELQRLADFMQELSVEDRELTQEDWDEYKRLGDESWARLEDHFGVTR